MSVETRSSDSTGDRLDSIDGSLKNMLNGLAVKVGLAIVLAEIIVLSALGTYYVSHLNKEIDNAAASRLHAVGALLQEAHLKYSSVADRQVMTELVGEELEDGMVIGATGNVFHALDPANLGRAVSQIEDLDSRWFASDQVEQQIIATEDELGSHLIGITPLFTFDSNKPFLFAYVRVNTQKSVLQKNEVRDRVLYGSLICVILTTIIIFISFNKLILRRIRRTARFARRVRDGDFGARLRQVSSDELGGLEGALNSMAIELARQKQERDLANARLREANETLENRVEERTKQLREAIDQLEREVEGHKLTGRAFRRQSSIVRLLQRITVAANESATVDDALQVCLDAVCNHFGWPIGHVYRVREDGSGELECADIWHLEDEIQFNQFKKATEKDRVVLGEGLPGRVLRSGSPVWITGGNRVQTPREKAADECGLAAGFAFPVMVGREVVAVLEFYTTSSRKPESDLFEIMRDVGVQLGRVVERRRAEKRLQKAMVRADRASRAKSEFLSALSHELRTPMNAILGFGQLLYSSETEKLSERQSEQVGTILKAGTHMIHLINQVLDLAKIEAGHYSLNTEYASIKDIIDQSLEFVRPMAKANEVTLELDLVGTTERTVYVDRPALVQSVQHILSNAILYGGKNKSVVVSCLETAGGWIRISVRDEGPGISERDRENVFKAFYRLDETRGNGEGTGIGLNITRRLVEMMGGTIDFVSEIGAGTEFFIDLPGFDQSDDTIIANDIQEPAELG
ncbi:ATP-binding protein [Aestuariispira insulae]|uniref:histidine kinase n=1 Tax=Aestuariispira insulae TaxID=1461337 RepID=A0A3D9HWN0_9PROT|nr:ATP-binding protein [Aestuariispira insulae]RED53912.1 signal transduction histidine kinase [Aestuariispira insulae]